MSKIITARTVAALLMSASAAALFAAPASAADNSPAPAADKAAAVKAKPNDELVITGTRIRGIAPIGSSLVQVDRQDVAKTGLTSAANLLYTLPSVLSMGTGSANSGGSDQQTASLNGLAFNKSANLRGLGPGATLNLVNGHRVPYEGGNMNSFDGDDIPTQMLERVEVVQDGTSPIYGADAIAGTVNFILRKPENTIEASGQYGWADGQQTYQATAVVGRNWGSGGLIVSYQRTHADRLAASSRPDLYSDNYSAFGGPPSSDFSSPGNVVVGGVDYAIPAGQNGSALTLAQLGAAGSTNRMNSWIGFDAEPESDRDTVAANFVQHITDHIELFADGFYSDRRFDIGYTSEGPRVSAFVPNSNFYSPCNRSFAGAAPALVTACGTGGLTVDYSTVDDAGVSDRHGYARGYNAAAGLHIDLPYQWRTTLEATGGQHQENAITSYFFGNGLLGASSLAGTTSTTAYNVFCDGSQFTCNPSSLTSGIPGTALNTLTTYTDEDYQISADGPLFTLPGGPVRLALGVERYYGTFINQNNFGVTPAKRHISSGFAELYVPLVGEDNNVPLIRKLELDVAGRIDKYSDVGTTRNPKIGVNWTVVDDFVVHASYGTSFRAPGLIDNDPFAQHGYIPFGPYPGSSVTSSLCTACAGVPGGLVFYDVIGGANGDLKPETAKSYSVGADWKPHMFPGFTASVNYWWINYKGQINTPVYNVGPFQAVNQQFYNNYIIYNPTLFPTLAANNPTAFFGNFPTVNQSVPSCAAVSGQKVTTQAQFNSLVSCINASGDGGLFGPPSNPANVAAIESGHRINSGVTQGDGLDLSAQYAFNTTMGSWQIGANAEYITDWNVSPIGGAPSAQQVNNFSYPLRFKARANIDWSNEVGPGRLSANGFLNFSNAYHIDQDLLPAGVSSQYTHISAYTTVDLAVSYMLSDHFGMSLARNTVFTVSVQDLFDAKPPLVLNAGGIIGNQFDPANANPLERAVQVQVSKKF